MRDDAVVIRVPNDVGWPCWVGLVKWILEFDVGGFQRASSPLACSEKILIEARRA